MALLGIALIVGAFLSLPAGAEGVSFGRGTAQDPLGDVVDLFTSPVTVPAADITGATLEYSAGWIRAEFRTFGFTDPVKDERWQSADTFGVWSLETTGDDQADFLVEFGITDQKELYGDVLRADSGPDDPVACAADSVSYSSTAMGGSYELRLDPECLGRPAAIGYTVGLSFDTAGGGPVGTDVVPDKGFATAVPLPAPTAAPAPAAPPVAPPAAVTMAPQAGEPSTMARTPPSARPISTPAASLAPSAAPKPRHVAPPSTAPPVNGPVATPRSSSSLTPVTTLPRTGPVRAGSVAALGVGTLLMGIGVLVMVPRAGQPRSE